ncbi:RidA family protein [Methylovirgula sp. 4M-Z18]|uniref:RidA family protein n=1 Tax=Methylovirgula sp. 4M-Z18 TaxID=2293567 RepID=UPI000E2F7304|nr:RidA family protein [Methylovirgula sp. 4M-Z18]RFB78136.1 RidA family protein [Methylovirgula sp. 4M-Z18]
MKKVVDFGLPNVGRPMEWAILADGILYTTLLPIFADGTFETGDIRKQTELTLDHLKRAVTAAGGTMEDVTQVVVHLPHPDDFTGMNEVYGRYFSQPYPQRATLVTKLIIPHVRIEIMAYAHIAAAK